MTQRLIEVIGAGFPRTGTMSVKLALEALGFGPCYHMHEVTAPRGRDHVQLWTDAARGARVDWQELFRGYRATVDIPGAAFWRELLAAFPEARVLLTVRDPEAWYASVAKTIYALGKVRDPRTAAFSRMVDAVFWQRLLGGRFEDKAYAIGVYERHNEEVRRAAGADRLLVLDVKEGWSPLCDFLGVAAPAEPFPHANDTEVFTDYLRLKWPAGEDSAASLHERMLALEQQLLDEILSPSDRRRPGG